MVLHRVLLGRMPAYKKFLYLVAIMAVAFVLVAGCTSPVEPTTPTPTPVPSSPSLSITSPEDEATLPSGAVKITVEVQNFNLVSKLGTVSVPGEGHLHYYMDVTVPTEPGTPAVTDPGTFAPTPETSYTWESVTPGVHTFSVMLVNNDHTPLEPPVLETVTVSVEE